MELDTPISGSNEINWLQKLGSEVGHQKVPPIYDRSARFLKILNDHRGDEGSPCL
jgi:hypothetical protein